MKERPILMSAPMVRSILAGTKSQTRRVVKPEGAHRVFQFRGTTAAAGADEPTGEWGWCGSESVVHKHIRCPYGVPGDRLWVREAWRAPSEFNAIKPSDLRAPVDGLLGTPIVYEATRHKSVQFGKLRPGMFMPRWASRFTLQVTGVRVERLQDISNLDALEEGITVELSPDGCPLTYGGTVDALRPYGPVEAYRALWERLNGAGSWDANPLVWVVEFKRIEEARAK